MAKIQYFLIVYDFNTIYVKYSTVFFNLTFSSFFFQINSHFPLKIKSKNKR